MTQKAQNAAVLPMRSKHTNHHGSDTVSNWIRHRWRQNSTRTNRNGLVGETEAGFHSSVSDLEKAVFAPSGRSI